MSKLDQNKTPLFTVLKDEYVRRNILPFHVPGHKRGKGVDKEFFNNKKLTFAANSLNSLRSNTARFARLISFNFSSKI